MGKCSLGLWFTAKSKLSSALMLRIFERGSVCLEAYSSSQVHSFQFASLSLRRASLLNLIFQVYEHLENHYYDKHVISVFSHHSKLFSTGFCRNFLHARPENNGIECDTKTLNYHEHLVQGGWSIHGWREERSVGEICSVSERLKVLIIHKQLQAARLAPK